MSTYTGSVVPPSIHHSRCGRRADLSVGVCKGVIGGRVQGVPLTPPGITLPPCCPHGWCALQGRAAPVRISWPSPPSSPLASLCCSPGCQPASSPAAHCFATLCPSFPFALFPGATRRLTGLLALPCVPSFCGYLFLASHCCSRAPELTTRERKPWGWGQSTYLADRHLARAPGSETRRLLALCHPWRECPSPVSLSLSSSFTLLFRAMPWLGQWLSFCSRPGS